MDHPEIISRSEARARGLTFYWTGKPCKRGHIAKRYASDSSCVTCAVDRADTWQRSHPEKCRERDKRFRDKNPGQALPRQRRWLEDPANLEKKRGWHRRWRDANPEAAREATRDWRDRNLEYDQERCRNYQSEHPEEARHRVRQRRALLAGAEGSHTIEEIMALLERQGGICVGPGCGTDIRDCWTVDHIEPITRGGSDYIENIQLLCHPCNTSKGNRPGWKGRRMPKRGAAS
jgi:hypothetical protein